jgi:hypothetical protein
VAVSAPIATMVRHSTALKIRQACERRRVCGVKTLRIARPFVTTARPVQARRRTPATRVPSWDVPLEKCEWMSALPMAR